MRPAHIPVHSSGAAPGDADVGSTLKYRYATASTLERFVADATINRTFWADMAARARAPMEFVAWARQLTGKRRLLVLLEDWCGDAVNTIPVLAALAEAAPQQLELRVLRRDENVDLIDVHLTSGARAIPVVLVLDENYVERGWWGPRPADLQRWVSSTDARAMTDHDRYREVRRWYARDRGRTTLAEVLLLIECTMSPVPRVA